MKIILTLIILTLIVSGVAYPQSQSRPAFINDWRSVEDDLMAAFKTSSDYQHFNESELFKKIRASHSQQLFVEMTTQSGYPCVAVAGFLCLKEQFPDQTLVPAMQIILEAAKPSFPFYDPVFQFLREQKENTTLQSAFSSIATRWGTNEVNLELLIGSLPYDFLYNWFHSKDRSVDGFSFDAVILDRLYGEATERQKPLSKTMAASLEEMKYVPGLPRIIFVLYSGADKAAIKPYLKLTLEDQSLSVPSLTIIVLRRKEHVQELLSDGIAISKERRDRIEKIVKHKHAAK